MNKYRISEFAKRVGKSTSTIRRWESEGKIETKRSLSGQRYFDESDVRSVLMIDSGNKKTVVYCRVSNSNQKDDLLNQISSMEQYCLSKGICVDEWISEVGSGMNFKRKKFLKLVSEIISGDITTIIVAHQDRLMRFGFDMLKHLALVSGCTINVVNQPTLSPQEEVVQAPQEEVVQDLMTIIHVFSCRLYGLRKYKKKD